MQQTQAKQPNDFDLIVHGTIDADDEASNHELRWNQDKFGNVNS